MIDRMGADLDPCTMHRPYLISGQHEIAWKLHTGPIADAPDEPHSFARVPILEPVEQIVDYPSARGIVGELMTPEPASITPE